MHWGLTAFERKRIERIALDHPYFDMHAPLLTKRELRTILAQGPRKTGPQVVAEVKKEVGIAYAHETQEKRTLAEALRDASFVPSFRRAVVLSIFCLLLALFMTFTVPGRAFAEEVYSIVINLVDGMLSAHNIIPSNNESSDYSLLPTDLKTPYELSQYIDRPLFISNDLLVAFEYEVEDPEVLSVLSLYQNADGQAYAISQENFGANVYWGLGANAQNDSIEIELPAGVKMYLNQASDGTIYAFGFFEACSLRISSQNMSLEEFLLTLQDVKIIE